MLKALKISVTVFLCIFSLEKGFAHTTGLKNCFTPLKNLFDERTSKEHKLAGDIYTQLQKTKSEHLLVSPVTQLKGEVVVSSAKNALLPLLASVVLSETPVHIKNIPNLS